MDRNHFQTALSPAVYIVGAGPGDPDLLTEKAQKLIQKADVLIYANSLIPRQILSAVRPNAEKIATANLTLEDIVPLMIERVRAGKSVVRLQSGDPSLYSAIHEQMLRLSAADVPFEVVPGISAFQAAAAKLQAELTIPEVVQSIILTRISGRTQVPPTEELAGLAAHRASLCLYLSARHVQAAQTALLMHYPPQTPVAICFRVGWPDEHIQRVPLDQMAQVSEADRLVRTTLYIISPALANWRLGETGGEADDLSDGALRDRTVRSRLYNPSHSHLFRPGKPASDPKPMAAAADCAGSSAKIVTHQPAQQISKEQEQAKQ